MRPTPTVLFDPVASRRLQRGIDCLAAAVLPTLGPAARPVAVARDDGKPPDLLDDGATIARRILDLGDRSESVGAMLLRHLLWRVHERVGDGTASACAVFHGAYREGQRHIAAGIDPVLLRESLLELAAIVTDALNRQAEPAAGFARLHAFARSIAPRPDIARALADAFAVLGPHTSIEIRASSADTCGFTPLPGSYWKTTLFAQRLLSGAVALRSDLERVAILATDLHIDDPGDVRTIVDMARRTGAGSLLIFANRFSDACVAALLACRAATGMDAVAVRTPFAAPADQMVWMDDIELLTGATALRAATGMRLAHATPDNLGFARRAWCDLQYVGIVSGRTRAHALASRLRNLQARAETSTDLEARLTLGDRIATLSGSGGVLTVPDTHRASSERTARALRLALGGGLVPGGGIAYLEARSALAERGASAPAASRAVLQAALEAPFRQIARNQGLDPAMALSRANTQEPPVLDSAATVTTAWQMAIESAAQALTIGTIVHHAAPEEAVHP